MSTETRDDRPVRTYRGRSLEELIPKIREELGPDAIILREREGLTGGFNGFFQQRCVEVDAQAPPSVDFYDDDEDALPGDEPDARADSDDTQAPAPPSTPAPQGGWPHENAPARAPAPVPAPAPAPAHAPYSDAAQSYTATPYRPPAPAQPEPRARPSRGRSPSHRRSPSRRSPSHRRQPEPWADRPSARAAAARSHGPRRPRQSESRRTPSHAPDRARASPSAGAQRAG